MQPTDQVTADLFAEDIFQPIARDRLAIGDGGGNGGIEFVQA